METDVSVETEQADQPAAESAEDLAGFVAEAPESEPVQVSDSEPITTSDGDQLPDEKTFNPLTSDISDDEFRLDGFYEDLNEGHVKDLPTTAKRMLHNFRNAYKIREKQVGDQLRAKDRAIEDRMEHLAKQEREFARRQAEFAALSNDPDVHKILNPPRSEKELDPFSREGIQAEIQQRVAEGMRTILKPMNDAADTNGRQAALMDFVSTHPEMRDAAFKQEVVSVVKGRWESENPISTQDAFQLVKAGRVVAREQARAQQESAARARSARRVARKTSSGSPSSDSVPGDVKRRGAGAIVNWLRDNPEAAKRIRSQNS